MEVRSSLLESRARLDRELAELDARLHHDFSPRQILSRNPPLLAIAGGLLGLVLLGRPKLLTRSLSTVAQVSALLLVKALVKRI